MVPLLTKAVGALRPDDKLADCLVCGSSIHERDDALRIRGGGLVHSDCATYRMRQRDGRRVQRPSRNLNHGFTGE
jgi:hypothetical protein